jgi:hypothetical protein
LCLKHLHHFVAEMIPWVHVRSYLQTGTRGLGQARVFYRQHRSRYRLTAALKAAQIKLGYTKIASLVDGSGRAQVRVHPGMKWAH